MRIDMTNRNIIELNEGQTIIVKAKELEGYWIPISGDGYANGNIVYDEWECSNCGHEHNGDEDTLTAYCPDCGSKMKIGGD